MDVSSEPLAVEPGEVAIRILASQGAGAYLAYLVPADEASIVTAELHDEIRVLMGTSTQKTPHTAAELLSWIDSCEDVAVVNTTSLDRPEWGILDRRRSSLVRKAALVFVTTPSGFSLLMESAPNLASWLGGNVFSSPEIQIRQAKEAEARRTRLGQLRAWAGIDDTEMIRRARNRDLPLDPEYLEWLVLLGQHHLLTGG
jgi:hypothetical protein